MKTSDVKLTRRQLVIAAAAGSAALRASKASAQSAPLTATDKIRQNADTLAKFAIPITTEPAFQFKA
jgi:hypothetical protein